MSTSSYKPGQSAFISDATSADAMFKEYIEAPFAAAQQPAINTGLQLLAFMSALPDAFIASEKRELKRLAKTGDSKNDSRIERLQLSLQRADEFRTTALQGKTRIDRAIVAASTEENVFHGFVSDTNLKPREKLTVRISAMRDGTKDEKSLSAITDADGYFSISLGKEKPATRQSYESTVKLSDQMAERLASVNAKTTAGSATASTPRSATAAEKADEVLARVEILDAADNVLHEDSSPLVVNSGTAYREYLVGDKGSVPPNESRKSSKTESANPADSKSADSPAATTGKAASPGKKAIDKKTKK